MRQNFLGEFNEDGLTISKKYIEKDIINIRLYHTKYTPEDPKYTMVIVHGFGQHSGRFSQIATYFAKKSFQVLLVDLTGFGYSGGPRGCATVEVLENDVIALLGQARQDLPLFFYAHSLGGLATLKLLLERPTIRVSGCIVTSPLLGFPKDRSMPKLKAFFVKLVGDELEDIIVNSMVNPTALTKKNQYIQTIFEDRLMIPFLSVKMAKSIIQSIQFVNANKTKFNIPIIMFHGKRDSVTNYQDSKSFIYSKVIPYRQIHLFDNGFHELQHDEERDQLLERGYAFLQSLPTNYVRLFGRQQIAKIIKPKSSKLKKILLLLAVIAVVIGILKKLRANK